MHTEFVPAQCKQYRGKRGHINEETAKKCQQRNSVMQNMFCIIKIHFVAGYRLIEHGGELTGFHSTISMLPDMDTGLFFACNYGKHYQERTIITMFSYDILLDGDSFLDVESACQYLDDFDNLYVHSSPDFQHFKGMSSLVYRVRLCTNFKSMYYNVVQMC